MKDESNKLVEASSTDETELSSNVAATPVPPPQPKKSSPLKRILGFHNKYLFIFVASVLAIIVMTYIAVSSSKKSNQQNSTTQSLTDQQIASLKGSTTIVGDSQQTLDVQSNSIFEGGVLLRKNLDVAGTLKVGGALSLPSINIGGDSSFGKTQINGSLSVAGDATLQGQVSLKKNLAVVGSGSFGTLSASQLTVSTLQLTGNLTVNQHIVPGGSQPSKSNGSSLGGGGTASISGSDTAGTITINTGSGPSSGCYITITFTQKFSKTPHLVISPSNARAGGLNYYTSRSNTNFSVCSASAPSASTTYVFDYIVFD